MKYVDIKYLLYYLSSPPHTIRMTCALSCESILCKRGTLPACTAWTLRMWNRPGGPVSCTSTCCSCANLQHQNHMNSTCFSSPSTLFYSNTMSMAVVVHAVYLPGRMGLADCHRHMAWGPEVHPDRVRRASTSTAISSTSVCCDSSSKLLHCVDIPLVDIGVVPWVDRFVWEHVRWCVGLQLLPCRGSLS